MKINDDNKMKKWYFPSGILLLALCYTAFMIRGDALILNIHDQADGELVYYMLRSGTLGAFFQTRFAQFMNGSAEVSVASFGSLLFYYLLPPVYAFISNMFFVRMVSFAGLYLLLRKLEVKEEPAFLVSIIYAILPIYSVYGLSNMGGVLVWLSVLLLAEGKKIGYLGIAVYGLFSSLVLVGFAVLGVYAVYLLTLLIRKQKILPLFLGFLELLLIYVLSNLELLRVLFVDSGGFVSHKSAYQPTPQSFFPRFFHILIDGQYHAVTLHRFILGIVLLALLAILIFHKKMKEDQTLKKQMRLLVLIAVSIALIAVFYGFFKSSAGISLRKILFSESILLDFQFDRVYWLYPTLWYVAFGLSLSVIHRLLDERLPKFPVMICILTLWGLVAVYVASESDVIFNLRDMIQPMHVENRWKNFFAEDLFEEISDVIGEEKETYRVVSVGLHPSAALYNGFYCVDGYSNNYDLAYKERFGEMERAELSHDASNADYFWRWGNRCYLYPDELKRNCFLGKDMAVPVALDIEVRQLKELGAAYMISAVPIQNDVALHLKELGRFENDESFYALYLYKIEG